MLFIGGIYLNQSKPKFLNIYNTLYEEIRLGKFSGGKALPTEKSLCERFNVSRMTLRQAIKLLVEDNMIESIRGKGHIVISQIKKYHTSSVNSLQHPLHQTARFPMKLGSLNYRVDLQSDYTNHLFKNHPTAVIAIERYYFEENKNSTKADAFCFTFLPIDIVETYQINTQNHSQMKQFVENTIYQSATKSDLKFSSTKTPTFSNQQHVFEARLSCWLVVESIYGNQDIPILVNKWYLPQEDFEIIVSRMRQE